MPTTIEILDALKSISNDFKFVAIIWHAVLYLLIIALLMRMRITNKSFVIFLSLLTLSVGVFAWYSGNPFNGTLFSIAFLLILIFGLKTSRERIKVSSTIFLISGIILTAFGLWYPHFLDTNSITKYLYEAPTGLIPCPTLSVIIGFALIFNRFNSKPLTIVFISFGLFYGIFGIFKLGVYLDIPLLIGTLILLLQFLTEKIDNRKYIN